MILFYIHSGNLQCGCSNGSDENMDSSIDSIYLQHIDQSDNCTCKSNEQHNLVVNPAYTYVENNKAEKEANSKESLADAQNDKTNNDRQEAVVNETFIFDEKQDDIVSDMSDLKRNDGNRNENSYACLAANGSLQSGSADVYDTTFQLKSISDADYDVFQKNSGEYDSVMTRIKSFNQVRMETEYDKIETV